MTEKHTTKMTDETLWITDRSLASLSGDSVGLSHWNNLELCSRTYCEVPFSVWT
jgi:hypothetical protein